MEFNLSPIPNTSRLSACRHRRLFPEAASNRPDGFDQFLLDSERQNAAR